MIFFVAINYGKSYNYYRIGADIMNFKKIKLSKRKILTISLVLVVFVMSLGYAALSQHMDIDGIASIDRSWIVKVTNVTNSPSSSAVNESSTYVGTTVTMNANLPISASTIIYTIILENQGNIPAKLSSIEKIEDENYSIVYEIMGAKEGYTVLEPGEKNTIKVIMKYKSGVTNISNTKKSLMLSFNYVENSGNSGTNSGDSTSTSEYIAFKPGDAVMYDPGDGTEKLFYVVSNSDTTSSSTVQLLSHKSVGTSTPAINASSQLSSSTSSWSKASNIRIPSIQEIANLAGISFDSSNNDHESVQIIPDWLSGETMGAYTITSTKNGSNYYTVLNIAGKGSIEKVAPSTNVTIRPIVTANKNDIKGKYEPYKLGDYVTLVDGSSWVVTKDSGTSNAMVTLYSKEPIAHRTIDTTGAMKYDPTSSTNLGYYINNTYLPTQKDKIDNSSGNSAGLTARILTVEEFNNLKNKGINLYNGATPTWIIPTNTYNILMGNQLMNITTMSGGSYDSVAVTPVITLLKENIKTVDFGHRIVQLDNKTKNDNVIDFFSPSSKRTYKQEQSTTTSEVSFSSSTTYYYGKSFKFNESTGYYSLDTSSTSNYKSGTWSAMTSDYKTYPYTCKSTSATGTCKTLYKMTQVAASTGGAGYTYTSSVASTETNGGGLYQTNTNTEDNKTTYYFRGNVTNNYVKFAGFYWRIVRVNEDGSVRLIYQGTSPSSTGENATIGASPFNFGNDNNAYVGYMYGDVYGGSYAETHANVNSSTVKDALDLWYNDNLISYGSYLADAGFCNDRSLYSGSANGSGVGTEDTIYGSNDRLYSNGPIFSCPLTNDLFTTTSSSKGNKALDYPIGLLTIDEAVYAGSAADYTNTNYYLNTGGAFWTMTAGEFSQASGATSVLSIDGTGAPVFIDAAADLGLRPVINLKTDVKSITGNGTSTNPYVIS